jgi:hypothetical protein
VEKTWRKPELVVLVRNRPEEAILQACKNFVDLGANDYHDLCGEQEVCSSMCADYSAS